MAKDDSTSVDRKRKLTFTCVRCGGIFETKSIKRERCEECIILHRRESASKRYSEKRSSSLKKNPIKPLVCDSCGSETKRTSANQKRCHSCAKSVEHKRAWQSEKAKGDEYLEAKRQKKREWASRNKNKIRENGKAYREKNSERISSEQKKYASENKDRRLMYHKKWRDRNRDKVNTSSLKTRMQESSKQRARAYRKTIMQNPIIRLTQSLRCRVKQAFRNASVSKDCGTFELLGMTGKEFQEYLMNYPGKDSSFTMENYGKTWVVDHIRPIASFDMSDPEHRKVAFHYTNCQPLGKKENGSKGNFWKGYWWKDGKPFLYPCVIEFNKTKDCSA